MSCRKTAEGLIIEARIKTGASSFSIKDACGQTIIEVDAPPLEGKANTQIVKQLKKLLKADSVEIVKGQKSKDKVILVRGNPDELEKKINDIKGL